MPLQVRRRGEEATSPPVPLPKLGEGEPSARPAGKPKAGVRSGALVAAAVLVAAALVLLPPRSLRADGGVFATTKHGDPAAGIQRLTGADYPRGACVQCHYQHASTEGASTGTPNPYALFAANDNNLCGSTGCHAETGANHIYQGLSDYSLSTHATAVNAVWPGPNPWARRSTDHGKCINCHDPHGDIDAQGLIPTLGLAREQALCLACHDGSPANSNIQFEITKSYSHPATSIAGRHTVAEGNDPAAFGSGNRHAECEDCHNPHEARHPSVPPTAPAASDRLRGISYLQVINGAAWTQPSYLYHAADDPTPIQYEYQLCFKCHSSWTTLPPATPSGGIPTDKAKELNPNNLSYHPVEAAGKQTTATWPANALLPPYTTASILYCSDCHASDTPSAPEGPHGSTYRYLLKADYRTDEHAASYVGSDYGLCYSCHSETALLSTSGSSNTNFTDHARHLQRANGDQPYLPTCNSCHGNVHGSDRKRLVDFSQDPHLTSFTSWTSKEDGGGRGTCVLTCHGHGHNARY